MIDILTLLGILLDPIIFMIYLIIDSSEKQE
jgi:hypothetical protein